MKRQLKILISAYACEPGQGSEPGIGWNMIRQIARFHEVWAITRVNNRKAIEQAMAKEPIPNLHWFYFDLPQRVRFWKKGQRGIRLYYYLWQVGAYFVGKQLHKHVCFDLVHHVTFVTYWMPSFLSLLPVPFIWGPVGGGESTPKRFYRCFDFRGKVYEYLRDMIQQFARLDPFVRLTARRARVILATTTMTGRKIQRLGNQNIKILPAVGLSFKDLIRLKSIPIRQSYPFRLVSIGRLIHWKGFHLALRAFAKFQQEFPETEYRLVGDGPERKKLEKLAQKLGVDSKVQFLGNLPRHKVLEKLEDCDALVFPSFHDSGGFVSLEAMAARLPVICLELGGPALQVTEKTGFKVPARAPEQVVNDIAKAMLRLAKDLNLKRRMGQAARERIFKHFTYEKKAEQIEDIYQKVFKQYN